MNDIIQSGSFEYLHPNYQTFLQKHTIFITDIYCLFPYFHSDCSREAYFDESNDLVYLIFLELLNGDEVFCDYFSMKPITFRLFLKDMKTKDKEVDWVKEGF